MKKYQKYIAMSKTHIYQLTNEWPTDEGLKRLLLEAAGQDCEVTEYEFKKMELKDRFDAYIQIGFNYKGKT